MISSSSRYVNEAIIIVNDDRGVHQSVEVAIPGDQTFNFTNYQVTDGETADSIAFDFFDDGTLWWVIADANPEIIDWHVIPPGTILRIPDVVT